MVVAAVPWARHGSGFTRAFEDTAAWLAVHTSKAAVRELLRVAWRTVGRIVARVAADAEQATDRFAGLTRTGIDEIAYKRGHRYLTVLVDHDTGRLLWAAPGHDAATLGRCFDLLGDERCAAIRLASRGRGRVGRQGRGRALPQRSAVPGPVPRGEVGDRRARPGPPGGVERRPQGRADGAGR